MSAPPWRNPGRFDPIDVTEFDSTAIAFVQGLRVNDKPYEIGRLWVGPFVDEEREKRKARREQRRRDLRLGIIE